MLPPIATRWSCSARRASWCRSSAGWGFSPVLGYLGAGALLGPLGLGLADRLVPGPVLVHRRRRQGRRRHRRARHRLPAVPDRPRTVAASALDHAAAGFRPGRIAGAHHHRAARRRRRSMSGQIPRRRSSSARACRCPRPRSCSNCFRAGAPDHQCRAAPALPCCSLQDLAVIPILMFISLLAAGPSGSVLASLGRALVAGRARARRDCRIRSRAVAAVIPTGRGDPLARSLHRHRTLFVIIAAGVIANQAGLSMALGAFVAGLLLAETEYRKAIEATIEPFKGLLLGIFFFTVGMDIDVRELLREPLLLAAAVVGLIAVKSLLIVGLAKIIPPVVAGRDRDGIVARPRRRIRVRRHRHAAAVAGLIDARLASFCARRHLGHHGADAAVVIRGAAFRFAPAGGRRRAVGADGTAERRRKNTRSSSATAASAKWCARCSRSTAFPISPQISMPTL